MGMKKEMEWIFMMHLNDYGLYSRGFRRIASYECFKKGCKKFNIVCYTNGTEYLVRTFETGSHAWDNIFTDKAKANANVDSHFKRYTFHKRTY